MVGRYFKISGKCIAAIMGIIVLIVIFSSCSSSKQIATSSSDWELKKVDKKNGYQLFSRSNKNSAVKEFKVEGIILGNPQECITQVREKQVNNAKYIKKGESPIKILWEKENQLLTYSISEMPFPIKDREMCEKLTFYEKNEGSETGVDWKEAWDECPVEPTKKLVRMPIIQGSWKFVSLDSNKTKVEYRAFFDPGKGMPSWMVNAMAGQFLMHEVTQLSEMVKIYLK